VTISRGIDREIGRFVVIMGPHRAANCARKLDFGRTSPLPLAGVFAEKVNFLGRAKALAGSGRSSAGSTRDQAEETQ